MKVVRAMIFAFVSQLAMSSCAGDSASDFPFSESATPIAFDTYLGRANTSVVSAEKASSRAADYTIDQMKGEGDLDGFGVFALYHHDNQSNINFFNNEHVKWDKTVRAWTYHDTKYWPSQGTIDFYAYAHYYWWGADNFDANKKELHYEALYDLDLVCAKAEGMRKPQNGEKVKLKFSHVLSRVGFNIRADFVNEDVKVIVKQVKIRAKNDQNLGAFPYKGNYKFTTGDWNYDGYKSEDLWTKDGIYTWEKQKPDGKNLEFKDHQDEITPSHLVVSNADYSFAMPIPYHLVKAMIEVDYSVVQGMYEENFHAEHPIEQPFARGTAYTLNLKIGSPDPVYFSVEVESYPWPPDDINPQNERGNI